jgi:hypothetical protein
MDQFEEASKSHSLKEINTVLAKVDLWQDENGMNWSKENNASNP